MIPQKEIRIKDYEYELPQSVIASYPLTERDGSKLLVLKGGIITDSAFRDIADHIDPGYTLVFNNTRVIRARLRFSKDTGSAIEIFCLEPANPVDYQISFASKRSVEWSCLVGNLKKWKSGPLIMDLFQAARKISLKAELISRQPGNLVVRFDWDCDDLSFSEILLLAGHVPVPPYLNREDEEIDTLRYQTVYSRYDGSVAAPTAGLHFTGEVLEKLTSIGIRSEEITLHVGAGTFVPVKSDTIGGHEMHTEHFTVSAKTISSIIDSRIIAVGTTSVRTLESLYWLGIMALENALTPGDIPGIDQWIAYEGKRDYDRKTALEALLKYMKNRNLDTIEATTAIIIVPGYRFRIVEGLITNYHMPGSTLLLLVSALIGERWREVYKHALAEGYRFLSYGDSSLLIP